MKKKGFSPMPVYHYQEDEKYLEYYIKKGEKFDFVEFMACPGGCIGGGGQPIPTNEEVIVERMTAVYDIDTLAKHRKSHENESVKRLYKEFFGEPLSERSHELLHTSYTVRH